ncbi:MAG TPA: Hpt domain-containing protein [Bdellovibrio sp.]|uniref:Hpt domain-containing protein n=1 Tax=Bdellovibrio sp. TaxID=28201 RepID=UPI002F20DCA3
MALSLSWLRRLKFKKQIDDQIREQTAEAAVHASNALIDTDALLRLKELDEGKSELIQQVTELFYTNTYTEIKQMETSANRQELFEVREIAHRMRSSALSLGAKAMADICSHIEKHFEDWDEAHRNRSLKELENCFILSMNELRRVTKELSL